MTALNGAFGDPRDRMTERTSLTVVLAAGEGTRMRSTLPKVLHAIAGESILAHVLAAAPTGAGQRLAVVVGPDRDDVAKEARGARADAAICVQRERRGTAHAVLTARDEIARGFDDLIVLFGDTPLITPRTLQALRTPLSRGSAVVVLGFCAEDPTGYGRLLTEGDRLVAIREHADAGEKERGIRLCNGGVMALDGRAALQLLSQVGNANAKAEYYLTDVIEIANRNGMKASVIETTEDEVRGINTRAQLAQAEAVMQQRLREAAMDAGVTLIAPETVFLSADTKFGNDVVVEPFVVFGPGVQVEDGAVVHSFSHLVQAKIGKKASVGPYARLRPGTVLGDGAKIGNFVETKAATIDAGAKVNHLTYIGDAHIGANANIGAGTITCNYDGFDKHRTEIGKGAFVGSNSALVAPVKIGAGAYVGAGSVVTKDVPADALRVARGEQTTKDGWAKRFREVKTRAKAATKSQSK
jgi:bifunctional UDP-N-acetylglucosamine pyrophosphorylase / glucosamine-1-phosphate N-acetyltransferase